MDIGTDVYFWVTQIARNPEGAPYVDGYDFSSQGPCTGTRSHGFSSRKLWVVTPQGRLPFDGKVSMIHFWNGGWVPHLDEGGFDTFPCLLTTNEVTVSVFSGPVAISAEDRSGTLHEDMRQGVAVRGDDWLGGPLWSGAKCIYRPTRMVRSAIFTAHEGLYQVGIEVSLKPEPTYSCSRCWDRRALRNRNVDGRSYRRYSAAVPGCPGMWVGPLYRRRAGAAA